MSTFNETEALAYDLFQGDETDVRELSDKIVTTRKPHPCQVCCGEIAPGSRARALTERNNEERKVMTFYSCTACCAAMAASWTDAGKALDARYAIGIDARWPVLAKMLSQ